MMGVLIKEIMPICESDVKQVRNVYEKTADQIQLDVEIIKKWMEQQPHLPKDYDESRIERLLLRNKFRIEQTKVKVENYYTLRGLHLDYFSQIDPRSEIMRNARKCMIFVVLPKLTPALERITLCCLTGNANLFKVEHCMLYMLAILDLEISYDYAVGKRVIFDLKGWSLDHAKNVNVNTVVTVEKLHQDAFSGRLTGIEIVNAPSIFNTFFNMFKPFIKQKITLKVRMHSDLNTLFEVIPKDCLPVEYGGDSFSIHKLHKKIGEMLEEEREFLLDQAKKISDERLRVGQVVENKQFGVDGTFRKINID